MRALIVIIVLFTGYIQANGQSPEIEFHAAANSYIKGDFQQATTQINEALQKYPNDRKLRSLKEKLEKEQQQQQKNKDQENKDQKDSKENKDGKKGEDQQDEKDKQNKDKSEEKKNEGDPKEKSEGQDPAESDDKKNNDQNELSTLKKLQEMNMSEEKARMILEAMKNSEMQYLQQVKRRPTKPRDSNRPDW